MKIMLHGLVASCVAEGKGDDPWFKWTAPLPRGVNYVVDRSALIRLTELAKVTEGGD